MRYRMIDVRIWGDRKFRALSPVQPSGQSLFLYLLTNPNTNSIPGLYRAGLAAIAEELGWSVEDSAKAFDELLDQGLIKADFKARVIFIPNAIKYNKPQSPNVIRSWASHWDEIPECDLKNLAFEVLSEFIHVMGEGFVKAFKEAIAKAYLKPKANQEQDQDQDHEQRDKYLCIDESTDLQVTHVDEIFKYWKQATNHPRAKFDAKRARTITAALKLGFSADELKQAIDGCVKSSWHMGQNENKRKYDDISLIFRDVEHIERFMGFTTVGCESGISNIVSQIDHLAEGAI